jgi:hypothetical protein
MVNEIFHDGLIIAQAARATALVEEIVALCGWPLLLQPTVRDLLQHIDRRRPECLLFWLEADNEIGRAAELVIRLRDRGPRPYRIAVAHHLSASVEHTFRSAGVHSYFAVSGDLRALVEDALLPLVELRRTAAQARTTQPTDVPAPIRGPTIRASPATLRPP